MAEHTPTEVSSTDIALVGLAGRFPGAADAAELWTNVRAGRSGITRFTDEHLNAVGVPPELLADPDYVKVGSVIGDIDRFDADFFGFNPKEAQILDPQHRLFLEHSWHALEDAGCDPTRFDGSIGVFAGCAISTYMTNNLVPAGIGATVGELAVGLANDKDSLTLRVAHTLGLSGPAYGIQSYCSTSLVAVCAAATSLANFECDLALAGGVAVAVPGDTGYLYQQGGISSPDGECRAFDAAGQGSLLGNGVGVVALRRLEDAIADGDQVYAVLRGWAVNNDAGRKVGFTAPGVKGQAAVIAEALAAAGLAPSDIDYIEAHGTGTALGDAAEIAALQQVFDGEEVLLGSVKTNLGHLDRAAGVTGLIKTALALHHEEIPATRNFTSPNPQLAAGDARLNVVTELHPWPRGERPRRAGVSAFGIGGTNAHVVLEEAPLAVRRTVGPGRRSELLLWSARTAAAADQATEQLAAHLGSTDGALGDVANTLQSGRRVFTHRRALVADSTADAVAGLNDADTVLRRADSREDRPVAFLVPGEIVQEPVTASEPYESEPVFRAAVDACDPTGNPAADPAVAAFARGYALAVLARSRGIEPVALLGQGVGEFVAAHLAGVMPLTLALDLATGRPVTDPAQLSRPRLPVVSVATGELLTAEQATDPGYWTRLPVTTGDAGAALAALLTAAGPADPALLELGTAGPLTQAARALLTEDTGRVVPALPDAEALGRLWLSGVPIDWAEYQRDRGTVRVGLPGYPYQRERYWIDPPATAVTAPATQPATGTDEHVQLLTQRWTETPATAAPAPAAGTYVLYADGGGVADALAERLCADGGEVVVVRNGESVETSPVCSGDGPVTVVHLSALAGESADADAGAAVLCAARTIAAWGDGADTARIVLVTRGGQAATATDLMSPAQAAVAVLPIVAGQEYPGLDSRGIDLDPAHSGPAHAAAAAALIADELGRPAASVLTAFRGGRRLTPDYAPVPAAATPGATVRPGGRYLVTGGLGDVGLLLAEHLVRSGATGLVLASRSAGTGDPGSLDALRALGADVRTFKLDVTDTAAVRDLFRQERFDGVIHAAADAAEDTFRPLGSLDEATVARHFGAKVGGGLVLSTVLGELAADQAPDWCVLFSSTSAHLGGLAFGSYAAANAALAALPRRGTAPATGTRLLSAAWDTWAPTLARLGGRAGSSMAAHAMTETQALAAFDAVLGHRLPVVVVAAGGLQDRLPRPAGTAPTAAAGAVATFPRPELPQPYVSPLTATERGLAALWTEVLGVEPVGTRDNFFDLGGNSLLALQMLTTVKARFGATIPTVTLFEAPTVRLLAAVLDQETTPAQKPAAKAEAKAAPKLQLTPAVAPLPAPAPAPASEPVRPTGTVHVPEPLPTPTPVQDLDHRIAIVGMAGRFPGAHTVGEFWRNLCDGVESITVFTPEELIEAGLDPETVNDPDYVPARAILDDVTGFDAGFFGMSPRMAALTDPQQRLFLEVCWEALEDSGYSNADYRERVGVFGGSNISTYLFNITSQPAVAAGFSPYEIIMSNDKDALTTSVSYLFDLRGPSVAVQSFCSTSLVGVHLAVQSLRSGDCEMALAGGVSVSVPDKVGHRRQQGGMESHDGHVHTFDADARGTMFGDGATVVVLKRLSDALRDGDTVHAVIRGSAMNNDGALKVGYTAPSVSGQARVVESAMADAGVTAEDIGYVEAHGTATELGDPIEVAALTRAFGPTERHGYCAIGAVKTNIGHLNHASGTAGLIKTALTVRERMVPATLNFTRPNPQIDFANSPFYVNTRLSPWPAEDGRPRIAGLNSLGMGGTNVHVVVEEPPARRENGPVDPLTGRRYQVLPVSARAAAAADQAAQRLGEHFAANPDLNPADAAFTLQVGRKTFEHRRAVVATTLAQAAGALTGTDDTLSMTGRVETAHGRPVAFLFAGVGEQYPGLVGELYQREPVFRAELDRCLDRLADALPGVDLTDLVAGARSGGGSDLAALLGRGGTGTDARSAELQRTAVVQPLMFAVDYALARTLMAWGLRPATMLGYSLGEYVAACLAGVLSLDDALALVVHRAQLIEAMEPGQMAAVPLGAADLRDRFGIEERGLDLAAVNGPGTVVVAGPGAAMEQLSADLREAGIPLRPLQTTHAFHSRMLAPVAEPLTAWITANITLNPPQLPYLSNVTGGPAQAELVCDPAYWAAHMCRTVQFEAAADELLADPELAVVEIGPGLSLGAMLRAMAACPPGRWPLIVDTLPAGADPRPADQVLSESLARLWLIGVDLDWAAYHGRGEQPTPSGAVLPGRIPLPTYPFQRQRYWIGAAKAAPAALTGADRGAGQLPGVPAAFEDIDLVPRLPEEDWLYQPVWRQTAAPAAAEQQPASWLVYTNGPDSDAVLTELRRSADTEGATVTAIRPGPAFAPTDDGWTVRPGNADDALAVLRALKGGGVRLERVVHLWTLAPAPGGTDETVSLGLHTLVALARAAGELGSRAWALDIVTTGANQVLDGGEVRPDAATLVGPALVVPLEYPEVTTRLIDAEQRTPAAAVAAELRRPRTDLTIAFRGSRRWVRDYDLLPPVSADLAGAVLREGGVYLITGGLGGIGLGMAENLARDCGAKLVLFGRRGLPPRERWSAIASGQEPADEGTRARAARVLEIIALGAEVEIVTGDVADPDDLSRAFALAQERFGALHGILHTAGVPGTGLMQFKHPDDSDLVLAPKVAGARAISQALRTGAPDEIGLDFLVLFSSITSATGGGPGQVDYCAANAYLDGHAASLAATGRPVLSIGWGEWTWNAWDSGLAGYDDGLQTFFRKHRAVFGITFEEGWRTLLRALASGESTVVASTQDLPTMVRFSTGFTVESVMAPVGSADPGDRHPRPELLTPYREPSGPTQERLAEVWCDMLKLERVGVMDNFFELGGNSLLGIALLAALRRCFDGAELPPHILYEAPTVLALARVVDGPDAGPAPAALPAPAREQAQQRRSGLKTAAARRRKP